MRCLCILLLFALAYALPLEDGDRQKRGIILLLDYTYKCHREKSFIF